MNSFINQLLEDRTALVGLTFLGISLVFFGFTMNTYNIDFDIFTGIFIAIYFITLVYFMVLMLYNKQKHDRYFRYRNFGHNIIGLQLFNISAYALNRSISVFHESVNWLVIFLIITNIALTYQAIREITNLVRSIISLFLFRQLPSFFIYIKVFMLECSIRCP